MTNPYSINTSNFTEDQLDEILGKWIEKRVSEEDYDRTWALIKEKRTPESVVDSGDSLHASHETYLIDGIQYACYWYVSKPRGNGDPSMICIQTRRPAMAKQMELFRDESI